MQQPMTLFVLPFAGGNIYSYRKFQPFLSPNITVKPLAYPGRGNRQDEAPATNSYLLASDSVQQIRSHLSKPYAIYGHSLGAIVGFLVCRLIQGQGLPLPRQLFVSGCEAPGLKTETGSRYKLPRAAFFELMGRIGGTPDAVLKEYDLMCYLEPLLRADIQAYDTYVYEAGRVLDIPITVFAGDNDPATSKKGCWLWHTETCQQVEVIEYSGNHFFIYDHFKEICRIMKDTLTGYDAMSMVS